MDENLCSEKNVKSFETYDKVVEALASRRFVRVSSGTLILNVFRGQQRDHLVVPCMFCTCEDYVLNYLERSRNTPCYHVIGFKIAETRGKLVRIDVDPGTLAQIVEEIMFDKVSATLRKLLR
uniref:SWIM-type domain-containing protein n=1 Tax=Ignisphaera aggregans TaxID=334771 RepID=A0A7C2VBQ4_9CREN